MQLIQHLEWNQKFQKQVGWHLHLFKPISQNMIANIEEQIGRVSIIPGEDLDLKGVTID
jgi:hypothetical protein